MNFQKLSSLISGKLGLKTSSIESTDSSQQLLTSRPSDPPVENSEPLSQAESVASSDQQPLVPELSDQAAKNADPSTLITGSELAADDSAKPGSKDSHVAPEAAETLEPSMDYDDMAVTNYTDEQLTKSKDKLKELMRGCSGIYGILIHTVDGHDLLSVFTRDIPSTKISTMTSSFLALGESIARESLQEFCQFTMIENSDGRIVSLRINEILMLTCISTKESNLGMLLSTGRTTAETISKLLGSPS